jgi:hypothetical protein
MIGIADGRSSATAEPAGAPMDDFDISELRIEPGADLIPTQKVLTVVPIRKPRKTEFVRVCPDPKTRLRCLLYIDGDDREAAFVIVSPELGTLSAPQALS